MSNEGEMRGSRGTGDSDRIRARDGTQYRGEMRGKGGIGNIRGMKGKDWGHRRNERQRRDWRQ